MKTHRIALFINGPFDKGKLAYWQAHMLADSGFSVTVFALQPTSEITSEHITDNLIVYYPFSKKLHRISYTNPRTLKLLFQTLTQHKRFDTLLISDLGMLWMGWQLSQLTGSQLVVELDVDLEPFLREQERELETEQKTMKPATLRRKKKAMAQFKHSASRILSHPKAMAFKGFLSQQQARDIELNANNQRYLPIQMAFSPLKSNVDNGGALSISGPVLYFHGQLFPDCGLHAILDIMLQLDTVMLVLTGRVQMAFLQKLYYRICQTPTLRNRVIFLQEDNHADQLAWLKASQICLTPSGNQTEMLGMSSVLIDFDLCSDVTQALQLKPIRTQINQSDLLFSFPICDKVMGQAKIEALLNTSPEAQQQQFETLRDTVLEAAPWSYSLI